MRHQLLWQWNVSDGLSSATWTAWHLNWVTKNEILWQLKLLQFEVLPPPRALHMLGWAKPDYYLYGRPLGNVSLGSSSSRFRAGCPPIRFDLQTTSVLNPKFAPNAFISVTGYHLRQSFPITTPAENEDFQLGFHLFCFSDDLILH